ncbi:MAG TPA: tail fiber domain-containing protein, partial [Chitinophagales bacterium]|nr:tail fiber domain-containing protein [Chitinophagales bacterium]
SVPGLAFITKLRPVTYHLDLQSIASYLHTPDQARAKDAEATKEKMLQTGFIAQEVEKSAKELGFDFSGVDVPKNETDFYGLRYAEFTVPLVKAVQELSTQNEQQQKIIDTLLKRLEALESK